MVRNTGEGLSTGLPHIETFVYSTSGLSTEKAMRKIPDTLEGFTERDMVVLNLGTSEVGHKNSKSLKLIYVVRLIIEK